MTPLKVLAPALVVLCSALATWKLTLGGRVIARGDLLLYFYPLRDFASQAIREWRMPLWNPYTFMGAPFLANSQAGFFYPLNIVFAWVPTPQAASWSIALHLLIAALGMFALARWGMGLGSAGAFASSIAFGLGGYLGAQVEHLNQLQVLAWLPLELCTLGALLGAYKSIRACLRCALALSLLLALQITAGHTQSLYICLVCIGLVSLVMIVWRARVTGALRLPRMQLPLGLRAADGAVVPARAARGERARMIMPLVVVVLSGLLAAIVCGAQLLPTIELAQNSARGGGLAFNEVASFSWRPWVIARALMPTYSDPLFPEYVCTIGATGLALALFGGLPSAGRERQPTGAQQLWKVLGLALCGAGALLALGSATPVFNALYRLLPGFAFFRAQARWLILLSIGASVLIGLGTQRLANRSSPRALRNWCGAWLLALVVWVALLLLGAQLSPEAEYRVLPAPAILHAWAASAAVAFAAMIGGSAFMFPRNQRVAAAGFALLLSVELLAASQFQPYARASDAQAVTELRPATAHLIVESQSGATRQFGRVLSLSSLNFDPGDRTEQELSFAQQLGADELYDRIIASKQKEILSPNLSLWNRLPSVDGYDGGLLPLRAYADFVRPLVERAGDKRAASVDGRLREFLDGVPASEWLAKMAVRFVVADKTADIFVEDVYYDTLFGAPLSPTLDMPLAPYTSTALGLLMDNLLPVHTQLWFVDGTTQSQTVTPTAHTAPNTGTSHGYARLNFASRNTPTRVVLTGAQRLIALSSIDASDGTFVSQAVRGPHNMRLIHSGDVKIYENLAASPRIEISNGSQSSGDGLRILDDQPERVTIDLSGSPVRDPALAIMRDACYPGWVARVDGRVVPIVCGEMQRRVALGTTAHTLEFRYEPASLRNGLALSAVGVLVWLALAGAVAWRTSSIARIAGALRLVKGCNPREYP